MGGSEWFGTPAEVNEADIVRTENTGVLIVGAGNGGMACAASCADLGLDFMICEKNATVEAARGFFGVVNSDCAQAAGIEVDPLKLQNELSRYAGFKNDPRVAKVWIDESAETKQWLEEHINKLGHEVAFNHKLIKLEQNEEGTITGAAFSPSATGEGIRIAMQIGAQLDAEPAPMIFNRGMVEPGVDAGYIDDSDEALFSGHIGQNGIGSQPFMKVDRRGRRIINESTPYDNIVFSAAGHEGGVWCMVFDANAPEDVKRFSTIGCSTGGMWMVNFETVDEWLAAIEQMMSADIAPIKKADTIEGLADQLGFTGSDKEAFLDQVDRYNAAYDAQYDDEFGKEPYRLSELRNPPFYGAWFGGSLLTTLQGLRIDEHMRVLDNDGKVMKGLFAVGDCSGSMFANTYPELIVASACGRTLTFGRHVARYLAGEFSA